MSGHRPFRDLTEHWPAARKVRVAEKAEALDAALGLRRSHKVRTGPQETPARRRPPPDDRK